MQVQQAGKILKDLRISGNVSADFNILVRRIGECKSKSEEDKIVEKEIQVLSQIFRNPIIDKSRMQEYLIRAIYIEMLGHDASFAHMKAIHLCSEHNLWVKKVAYLAVSQFMDFRSEEILLLLNTIQQDLKSDNYLVVSTALTAIQRSVSGDLIAAILPNITALLTHHTEHIRKKCFMCIHRFIQLDPKLDGALSSVEVDKYVKQAFLDREASVMVAGLCLLEQLARHHPIRYRQFIPHLTSILKQVLDDKLNREEYNYHKMPAPFIQIHIIKIIGILARDDQESSNNVYNMVLETLKRAAARSTLSNQTSTARQNISNAIIYQCIKTISTIKPNTQLFKECQKYIQNYLTQTSSQNLRFIGLDSLQGMIKVDPKIVQEYQMQIIDCLEATNDTIKHKTIDLLALMTNQDNVQVIVDKMLQYLNQAQDDHIKKDVIQKMWIYSRKIQQLHDVQAIQLRKKNKKKKQKKVLTISIVQQNFKACKIYSLTKKNAPSHEWFITTIAKLFNIGQNLVDMNIVEDFLGLLRDLDVNVQVKVFKQYLDILQQPNIDSMQLKLSFQILGEYCPVSISSSLVQITPTQLVNLLVENAQDKADEDIAKAYAVASITKTLQKYKLQMSRETETFVDRCANSRNIELQQRAFELCQLLRAPGHNFTNYSLDDDDFGQDLSNQVEDLSFLQNFFESASLDSRYNKPMQNQNSLGLISQNGSSPKAKGLKFEAYQAPEPVNSQALVPMSTDQIGNLQAGDGLSYNQTGQLQVVASSSDPKLNQPVLNAVTGKGQRWGPVQQEKIEPQPQHIPQASKETKAQSQSQNYQASQKLAKSIEKAQELSEKQKLAQSLFGGVSREGNQQESVLSKSAPKSQFQNVNMLDLDDTSTYNTQTQSSNNNNQQKPQQDLNILDL